jgi:hypothetical protein
MKKFKILFNILNRISNVSLSNNEDAFFPSWFNIDNEDILYEIKK